MSHARRFAKHWIFAISVLIAGLGASSIACAEAPNADPRRAQVGNAVIASMKQNKVPGASIAVIDNYQVLWTDGFGVPTAGDTRPVTPTTLFQAASISKPVAALAALRTVEMGKLQLDEDVNPRLVSWHIPTSQLMVGRPVTLRKLLSHTAGLNVHGFGGYATSQPVPSLVQVLCGAPPANSAPVKLLMKPGYKFSYSGGGYTVMQQLLIDVTGAAFPDYMRRQVLEPLGMNHSTYEQPLPDKLAPQAATGHLIDGTPIKGRWHVYPEMAAAGLWTTPEDLAKVVIEVASTASGRTGNLLSGGMIAEMLKPQGGKYGLGLAVRSEGRSFTFSHGGSNEGYRCLMVGLPATGQGVVIMTNSEGGSKLLQNVLAVVHDTYGWPAEE